VASLGLLKEHQRFSGAPYVLALPNNRWVRVVELRGTQTNGSNFLSHVDVTESRQQQEALKQLTQHLESLAIKDALTGLANRTLFKERLAEAAAQSRGSSDSLALLHIDLDRFKLLNDTLQNTTLRGQVAGSVAIIRESGVKSLAVGDCYEVGYLPWWEPIWQLFAEYPLRLAGLTLLCMLVLGWGLLVLLAGLGRKAVPAADEWHGMPSHS
ncbi:MAG: diguanylate cyclase, partial [Aeromonadaceae bacterium]|nr:diguanylate cyclase [Aeromonadaceae bacterium]